MSRRTPAPQGRILDLFAGAGGWDEGLGALGLRAVGVEVDELACLTATAAGHQRIRADITQLDPREFEGLWGLVSSPPCQAYSTSGNGLGWIDKPHVIACAHEFAIGSDTRRERLLECRDARSLLTVEPLRFALALRPRWVALEQVPGVIELWGVFAELLAIAGYHAAAGVLSGERYGLPQARKRAFLIASLDGPVRLPEATHRGYSLRRRPVGEDERALESCVSVARALGVDPAGELHTNNQTQSGRRPWGLCRALSAPAYAMDTASHSWTLLSARTARRSRGRRADCLARRAAPMRRDGRYVREGRALTLTQASVLQGFRSDYPWHGPRTRQFRQLGNAVPPPLARLVAEQAIRPGGSLDGSPTGSLGGSSCGSPGRLRRGSAMPHGSSDSRRRRNGEKSMNTEGGVTS
jgi:DNA (cytosine-5)-methyltransferase 1